MIDVSRVVNDPRLSKGFTLYRKSGEWKLGRWEQIEATMHFNGVIVPSTPEDIEQIPEGDRVGGEITIHCSKKLYVTHDENDADASGTSDEILWQDERYKIYSCNPFSDYGYYKAIGQRMASN